MLQYKQTPDWLNYTNYRLNVNSLCELYEPKLNQSRKTVNPGVICDLHSRRSLRFLKKRIGDKHVHVTIGKILRSL